MKKSKVVKDILGKVLFEKGFVYEPISHMYRFTRECQNKAGETISQQVYVQKNTFGNSLFFRMDTSAYGRSMVDAQSFTQNKQSIYPYKSDQEFIDCIKFFAGLMETKGFEVLEELSEPLAIEPPPITSEQELSLYKNYLALSEDFMNQYQISLECTQEQLQDIVFTVLSSIKDEPYEHISGSLIMLSAFYGEWFVKHRAGRWLYNNDAGTEIEFPVKNGHPLSLSVLNRIHFTWKGIHDFSETEYKDLMPQFLWLVF